MKKSQFVMLLAGLIIIAFMQVVAILVQKDTTGYISENISVITEIPEHLTGEERVRYICANVPEIELSADQKHECGTFNVKRDVKKFNESL